LREEFSKKFRLDNKNIIVSYPSITGGLIEKNKKDIPKKTIFFYPSLPRVFKNFETLIKAVKMLNEDKNLTPFEVVLTINGHENKYAEYIYTQLTGIENIKLLGLLSRSEVYSWYEKASCMVFPSKLETWGLPISEAKKFHLPIIVPDLEYAHETVGNYDHVSFFSLDDACSLAEHMKKIIKGEVSSKHRYPLPQEPFSKNWKELFEIILDSSL
jgi:glycosyltransferase involved in cell wall biosynthesis